MSKGKIKNVPARVAGRASRNKWVRDFVYVLEFRCAKIRIARRRASLGTSLPVAIALGVTAVITGFFISPSSFSFLQGQVYMPDRGVMRM